MTKMRALICGGANVKHTVKGVDPESGNKVTLTIGKPLTGASGAEIATAASLGSKGTWSGEVGVAQTSDKSEMGKDTTSAVLAGLISGSM